MKRDEWIQETIDEVQQQQTLEQVNDLRDQFAMAALNGFISKFGLSFDIRSVYEIADEMLAERLEDIQTP